MYCVMRASVPSLYNVYRRYDSRVHIRTRGMDTVYTIHRLWHKQYACMHIYTHNDRDLRNAMHIHCVHHTVHMYLASAMSLSLVRASSNWRCLSEDLNHNLCHLQKSISCSLAVCVTFKAGIICKGHENMCAHATDLL